MILTPLRKGADQRALEAERRFGRKRGHHEKDRRFDETYKRHAVDLTLQGDRTVKTVAEELGLPACQLYEWRKLDAPRPGEAGPAPQTLEEAEKEIGRLRTEVVRLRESGLGNDIEEHAPAWVS